MSVITHERLRAAHQEQDSSALERAALLAVLKRAAIMLAGFAIMFGVVAATIGLKAYFILSRMPLAH